VTHASTQPASATWLAIGVATLMGAVALWLDFGTLHEFHHADSLIPVLVSTQRWTPYFWGQDRFGMLVPLLAMPVRAPLANLLVQSWMMTCAALLAPFAIARFATDRPHHWIAAGASTNLFFLIVTAPVTRFDWLVAQPYALSIALGFAGLVVADAKGSTRAAFAFVLLLLAHWVNVGVVVLLAPAVVVRPHRSLPSGVLLALAAAAGSGLARWLPAAHTPTALTAAAEWPAGWQALAQNAASVIAHPMACAAIVAIAAACLVIVSVAGDARTVLRAAAVPAAAGLIHWLTMGVSEWVRLNLYFPRYTFPMFLMFGVAASIVIAGALRARVAAVACGLLTITALLQSGTPSLSRLSRSIDTRFSRLTPIVIASGATAIAGDYWTVWPSVFHANLTISRSGSRRRVFGLTYRSDATDPLWQVAGARFTVVGAPDDASVAAVAARHDVSLILREHTASGDLFDGRTPAAPDAGSR
jgi:hypothetical protein